jgi:hypothetical protein
MAQEQSPLFGHLDADDIFLYIHLYDAGLVAYLLEPVQVMDGLIPIVFSGEVIPRFTVSLLEFNIKVGICF